MSFSGIAVASFGATIQLPHQSYRHGTLSLYAALDPRTGTVVGQTAARHTSADFVQFLTTVVATQSPRREIHIILDNLATHKTKQGQAFLAAHPQVRLHFTPTYSSWLNQVELWFAKIERDVIARGHLHVEARLGPQTPSLHRSLQSGRQTVSMDLCGSRETDRLSTLQMTVTGR